MKLLPVAAKKRKGSDIVIYCIDAVRGKVLWKHDLPNAAKALSIYAYGFSSSSSNPPPITDGKHERQRSVGILDSRW